MPHDVAGIGFTKDDNFGEARFGMGEDGEVMKIADLQTKSQSLNLQNLTQPNLMKFSVNMQQNYDFGNPQYPELKNKSNFDKNSVS